MYTDGGSRGNPGPSGIGAVILSSDKTVLKEVSQFIGTQTNNWAEYEAVILGLNELKKTIGSNKLKDTKIEIKMDSELVVKQLSGVYQIKDKALGMQFVKLHNMRVKDFSNTTFTYVPRDQNKHADRLANDAMDKGNN